MTISGNGGVMERLHEMEELVDACTWPSEAYWRWFELDALRQRDFSHPLLELGCGDGRFTRLLKLAVDEGLDLNPRAVVQARTLQDVYSNVRCANILSLETVESGRYGTVFANSVFEHIEGIPQVLRSCSRLLRAGGTLITTVPLREMNNHLIFRSTRYARFRQRQLQHHNLWILADWISEFQAAGFGHVEVHAYLPGRACRTWDALDVLGTLGHDRYRVAPAIRKSLSQLLPPRAKVMLKRQIAKRLVALQNPLDLGDSPCAALIVGAKS